MKMSRIFNVTQHCLLSTLFSNRINELIISQIESAKLAGVAQNLTVNSLKNTDETETNSRSHEQFRYKNGVHND